MKRRSETSGSHALSAEQALRIEIRLQRAAFAAQPPRVQAETLARVGRLLREEASRRRNQPSELWRIAPKVYGRRLIAYLEAN